MLTIGLTSSWVVCHGLSLPIGLERSDFVTSLTLLLTLRVNRFHFAAMGAHMDFELVTSLFFV